MTSDYNCLVDHTHGALKPPHWQRLRRMNGSAGWPHHDAIEMDLLAVGLLAWSADGDSVHLTETAVAALERQCQEKDKVHGQHAALLQRMAANLIADGRLCYSGLRLRVRALDSLWKRLHPDLFSIRRTVSEHRLLPTVHEIKACRCDLWTTLDWPDEIYDFRNLGAKCYLVLGEGVGEPDEIPESFGVWMVIRNRPVLVRDAPPSAERLETSTWVALANATPLQIQPEDQGLL